MSNPIRLLAVAIPFVALACHSEQDVRDALADKQGCEIKKIEHKGSGSYDYTLHCGDEECLGTMKIDKGLGTTSTSKFESCFLREEACTDDAPDKCVAIGSYSLKSDEAKARTFFDRACKASVEHCQTVGDKYFEADNPTALAFYRRACDKPRKECALIGDKYLKRDEKEARGFYGKACTAAPAGCLHAAAKFDGENANITADYLERGCSGSAVDGRACFNLGVRLDEGSSPTQLQPGSQMPPDQ